jgi:hypothetical protein
MPKVTRHRVKMLLIPTNFASVAKIFVFLLLLVRIVAQSHVPFSIPNLLFRFRHTTFFFGLPADLRPLGAIFTTLPAILSVC